MKTKYLAAFIVVSTIPSCRPPQSHGRMAESASARTVFLSLPVDGATGRDAQVLISTPASAEQLLVCRDQREACLTSVIASEELGVRDGRRIFALAPDFKVEHSLLLRMETRRSGAQAEAVVVRFKDPAQTQSQTQPLTQAHTEITGNSGQTGSYDWKSEIEFVSVAARAYTGNTHGSATFKDIISHTKNPYHMNDGVLTGIHETAHFLLHEVRGRQGTKFIYYKDGQGAFLPEPKTLTGRIVPHLPSNILSEQTISMSVHDLYISRRLNQPLGENIFDEWLAYIVETKTLVESTIAKTPVKNDSVDGASVQFLYYCAVAMHTVWTEEKALFNQKNFKAIFAMLAEEASATHQQLIGLTSIRSDRAKRLMEHLRTAPSSQGIRDSLKAIYGADWTQRVLGF